MHGMHASEVTVHASADAVAVRSSAAVIDVAPHVGGARAASTYERVVKPITDRLLAVLLVLLLLPIIAAISLAVLVTLGHPVFFVQERVGHNGQRFRMYKFRSMIPDRRRRTDRDYEGPERRRCHKVPDDPRIVPVGRFIRRWSLDELPQLWNVLRGEMSLVGPRPELPDIVATYEPWQHARHVVKPGLTGPWQISERGERLMHQCTELDLEYLDRLTFGNDLRILTLTLPAAMGFGRPRQGH